MFYGKTYQGELFNIILPYLDVSAPRRELRLVKDAPEKAKQALKDLLIWRENQPPTPTNEDGMPLEMDW